MFITLSKTQTPSQCKTGGPGSGPRHLPITSFTLPIRLYHRLLRLLGPPTLLLPRPAPWSALQRSPCSAAAPQITDLSSRAQDRPLPFTPSFILCPESQAPQLRACRRHTRGQGLGGFRRDMEARTHTPQTRAHRRQVAPGWCAWRGGVEGRLSFCDSFSKCCVCLALRHQRWAGQ